LLFNKFDLIWSRRISEKSLAEWLEVFEGASVPYGPVNNIQEVFSDPQVGANVSVAVMISFHHFSLPYDGMACL